MKKTLVLATALLAFSTTLFSQQRQCGFIPARDRQMAINPAFAQNVLNEALDMQMIQEAGLLNHSNNPSRAVRSIPVVVHVVLNTQTKQNAVTNAMIFNMISEANTYFRKTTADTANIRPAFRSIATDCQIELCLAQRDPNGNATNGINRFITSKSCFDQDNGEENDMKSASTGGVNPWNQQKYLNIWVTDLCNSGTAQGGGTGGYAYIPYNGTVGTSIDGIVLEYEVGFWSAGSTLAHETGHYLGLHHIWGDAGGCSSTYPSGDDGFSDTPNSDDANMSQACGTTVNSCGTPAPGDQYENIMDYSNCPAMFTAQQSALMNVLLNGSGLSAPFTSYAYRSQLVAANNLACVSPNGPTASFTVSPNNICAGQSVTYTNTTIGATSVSWSFPGGTPSTSASTTTVTVTYNTAGSYNASLTATDGNGSNTSTVNGAVTVIGTNTLPLIEGFESATFPPTNWTINNPQSDTTWRRRTATNAGGFGTSNSCARVNNYEYQAAEGVSLKDWLITPAYSFSGVSNGWLKFDYAYKIYDATHADSLQILYSTNCGATWTNLWYKGGTALATATGTGGNAFVPTAGQWKKDSINLSALSGQSSVRFAFVNISRYGNNTHLDNINIYNNAPATNPPVANFSASNTSVCAGSSVTFTDLSTNSPTGWNWTFAGGTPSSSATQSPTITFNTPGTYTVTLTATNGVGNDSETKTSYITVNAKPTAVVTPTAVNCFGQATGSASVAPSGGTPNYTYSWSGGGSSASIANKIAGSYTVTVTDANSCSTTASATITQPTSAVSATTSKTDAGCGGSLGSATANASGGTPGYTYSWSNGANTQTASNLAVGSYTVTVRDSKNCSVTRSVTITSGGSTLAVTTDVTNASCGLNNGSATANTSAVGATYSWNTGVQGATLSGVGAGTYAVTASANGCSGTATVTIAQLGGISIASSSSTPETSSQANGSATVTATGAAPLSYSWNNGMSGSTITGLTTGSYGYTVTDGNGCVATGNVFVDKVTGIENLNDIERVALFPNPAQNQVQLDLEFKEMVKFSYSIHDALGRIVMQSPVYSDKNHSTLIPVSSWANGVYSVQVKTDNSIQTLKFIKQ